MALYFDIPSINGQNKHLITGVQKPLQRRTVSINSIWVSRTDKHLLWMADSLIVTQIFFFFYCSSNSIKHLPKWLLLYFVPNLLLYKHYEEDAFFWHGKHDCDCNHDALLRNPPLLIAAMLGYDRDDGSACRGILSLPQLAPCLSLVIISGTVTAHDLLHLLKVLQSVKS